MLLEKDLEDIISKYPDIIEEGLTLKGRQLTLYGRRMDLLFEDKFKRKLILELKIGPIKDQHIGQILSYEGMLLSADDPTLRIMLVGNRVPQNIQRSLDHHGIAWKEITFSGLKEFLSEKDDEHFLHLLDDVETAFIKRPPENYIQHVYRSPDELISALKSSEKYKSFKSILEDKIENENKAKTILIENLGNLNNDHIKRIIALVDEPYLYKKNGKFNHAWFGRLLKSNTGKLFEADPIKLNYWFNVVSNNYFPAEKKIDLLLNEPYNISGLNVGFITLILYLLDRNEYSIWFEGLHDGLRLIYPEMETFTGKSKQFIVFNETAKSFCKKYSFGKVELDWILSTGVPGLNRKTEDSRKKENRSLKLSALRQLQLEYWTGLNSYMETKGSFVKMRTPYSKQWSDVSLGMSDIYLAIGINCQQNCLNIWLVIRGQQVKNNFDKLYKLAFDDSLIEICNDIQWDRMEGRKSCAIKLTREADFINRIDWENQFEWLKEHIEKYVSFFKPRIKNLNP
jgi:hypothetical protein